jgi:hypothetical protein
MSPLSELDVNLQHQREARGKRLHATNEKSVPPHTNLRAQETLIRQPGFLRSTKASVSKTTPSPTTDQPRGQFHSGRTTPQSQVQSSKIPRRNAATPTPKPAFSPPISKWNLSATEKTVKTLQASPCLPTSRRTGYDQSLVREEVLD